MNSSSGNRCFILETQGLATLLVEKYIIRVAAVISEYLTYHIQSEYYFFRNIYFIKHSNENLRLLMIRVFLDFDLLS